MTYAACMQHDLDTIVMCICRHDCVCTLFRMQVTGQIKHRQSSRCCTVGKDLQSLQMSTCASENHLQQFNILEIKIWQLIIPVYGAFNRGVVNFCCVPVLILVSSIVKVFIQIFLNGCHKHAENCRGVTSKVLNVGNSLFTHCVKNNLLFNLQYLVGCGEIWHTGSH